MAMAIVYTTRDDSAKVQSARHKKTSPEAGRQASKKALETDGPDLQARFHSKVFVNDTDLSCEDVHA